MIRADARYQDPNFEEELLENLEEYRKSKKTAPRDKPHARAADASRFVTKLQKEVSAVCTLN